MEQISQLTKVDMGLPVRTRYFLSSKLMCDYEGAPPNLLSFGDCSWEFVRWRGVELIFGLDSIC